MQGQICPFALAPSSLFDWFAALRAQPQIFALPNDMPFAPRSVYDLFLCGVP